MRYDSPTAFKHPAFQQGANAGTATLLRASTDSCPPALFKQADPPQSGARSNLTAPKGSDQKAACDDPTDHPKCEITEILVRSA